MNFDFSDDQRAIKETAHELLTNRFKLERVRELAESRTYADDVWAEICARRDAWLAGAPTPPLKYDPTRTIAWGDRRGHSHLATPAGQLAACVTPHGGAAPRDPFQAFYE